MSHRLCQQLGLWPHNEIMMNLWLICGTTNDCGGWVTTTSIMYPPLFVGVWLSMVCMRSMVPHMPHVMWFSWCSMPEVSISQWSHFSWCAPLLEGQKWAWQGGDMGFRCSCWQDCHPSWQFFMGPTSAWQRWGQCCVEYILCPNYAIVVLFLSESHGLSLSQVRLWAGLGSELRLEIWRASVSWKHCRWSTPSNITLLGLLCVVYHWSHLVLAHVFLDTWLTCQWSIRNGVKSCEGCWV